MRQAPIKARNYDSSQQVCVLCRAVQQHTAVALVCSRLNMETRRALATMRHLVRQVSSHVLWHVRGTEAHQDCPIASVKDKMELGNIQDRRRFTTLPSKAAQVSSLLHTAHTSLSTTIGSDRRPECAHYG